MLSPLTQPEKELQLNLKTCNTQNCQKMELYGSPTTKDLIKEATVIQTGRRGKETETRRRGRG